MLNGIVHFSLRYKGVIIALGFVLLAYGVDSFRRAKYDVFPEFASPVVEIQTEAPGLSPEQVEELVTQPIENVINGVPQIDIMRSSSVQGLSVITVMLELGTDIYRTRQAVSERLTTLSGQLPQGVQAPEMSPLVSSTGDLMTIGLTSSKLSLMDLHTLAEWTVKRRILAVPGVAKIGVFGGEIKQFQIQVRPDRLIQYDLSIEDVIATARRATGVQGAGFIDAGNQRVILQTEGQSLTVEELSRTPLIHATNDNLTISLTLGDVANVTMAPSPPISAASVMGEPGVVLNVWAQNGANTIETTKLVEAAIAELRPSLEGQGVRLFPDLFRSANFIQVAVHNVQTSLLIGAVLVVAILFLFLFNFRAAVISFIAIPLSLLGAVIILEHLGQTLNTMTLGGLAIAIGEVVDDAIIDVENILRRLRENRLLDNPLPVFQVVYSASLEVRNAVVYATLAVVLIFVPILTLSGLAGRLFAPLGIAYILAILVSLLVALTVTPALCFVLLGGKKEWKERENPLLRGFKKAYRWLLRKLESIPKLIIGLLTLILLAGFISVFYFEVEFLPEFSENHYIAHLLAPPGTSLQESSRIGREVTLKLLKIPYVRTVAQRVGRAAVDDVFGTNESELEIDLKSLQGKEGKEAEKQIRGVFKLFPDVDFALNTFLTERIEETLAAYAASVVVNVYGNDLDILDQKAKEINKILQEIPGAEDVRMQAPPGNPQVSIRLRKSDLAYWGFDPVDVLETIRSAYQGISVGQIYQGDRVFDVTVILEEKGRQSVAGLGALPLRSPTGVFVKLRQIADIQETSGRSLVLHEGARRVQTVTCDTTGRSVKDFVEEAQKQILSKVNFPLGTYPKFEGTAEAQAQSQRDLLIHSLLTGLGIILLMSMVTGNLRNLLLVMLNLPFALLGGVLAAFLTGGVLSVGALVGFVTLFGITLRNSIMLISHYEHLVTVEHLPWGLETAIRGASERLIPILMTALVTALGLLPLALGSGTPGREIEGPMATVILGGLATSTILNLLILPTLALRVGRFGKAEP